MRSNLGNKYHKSRFGTAKQGFSEIITPMIIYYQHDDNFLSTRKNHLKKDFQTPFSSFILIKSKTYGFEN